MARQADHHRARYRAEEGMAVLVENLFDPAFKRLPPLAAFARRIECAFLRGLVCSIDRLPIGGIQFIDSGASTDVPGLRGFG
jgi:hypothetical protein